MEATATFLENSNDVNEYEVRSLLEENYDIASEKIKQLDGYDDFNFHILPPVSMPCVPIPTATYIFVFNHIEGTDYSINFQVLKD